MKIDPYKYFGLPRPVVCGMILEITSPKGIREKRESTGQYHYNLHTDLKQIYEEKSAELKDGLYWVLDISKNKDFGLHWNHFIMEIIDDEADIIEEYHNKKGSDWIPEALPTIKQHFLNITG